MEVEESQPTNNGVVENPTSDSIEIDPSEILQEVTEDLKHNIPIQAVDLLLEADMITSLIDMKEVDNSNVWKICQYLLRIVHFHYEEEQRNKIYETVYRLFARFNMWIDRLICAIIMPNSQYVIDTFNECEDDLYKKQMCEIIAKNRLSHLFSTSSVSSYSQILSSSYLSEWYTTAAKELDLTKPKLPETVLSLHKESGTPSSHQQAINAIVNGLVNAGHTTDAYFHDESGRWTAGFEKNKDIGLVLASISEACIHTWNSYEGLNSLIELLNNKSYDVRIGATFGVGIVNNGIYNENEDLVLNTLYSILSSPLSPSSSHDVSMQYAAALLAIALAYANSQREACFEFIKKGIEMGSNEVIAAAALAGGLVFYGSRRLDLIQLLLKPLSKITEDTETSLANLVLGFGFSMLYGKCQLNLDAIKEIDDLALPLRYTLYLQGCLLSCNFIGTQNILVIHDLISMINKEEDRLAAIKKQKKEEEEKNGTKKEASSSPSEPSGLGGLSELLSSFGGREAQEPKPEEQEATAKEDNEFQLKMLVLAIALVDCGEHVNESMVIRSLELMMVYGSKSVNEMVLLAFALMNLSNPSISIVDQMMRKTAGGGKTNKSNTSAYRSCVNAVIALGLTASGSCNSKIMTHLKQVYDAEQLNKPITQTEYEKDKAFYIQFAQGLVNLGKGLMCLSPISQDGMIHNTISLLFIMISLLPRLSNTTRVNNTFTILLHMMLMGAARPRCLMILDHKHENATMKMNMRVGQAVDTTGQAGNIRNISGFQTLEAPVLLGPGERAVPVEGSRYKIATHFMDGFVFAEEKQ